MTNILMWIDGLKEVFMYENEWLVVPCLINDGFEACHKFCAEKAVKFDLLL